MAKPKYLYHGSRAKIDILVPRKPNDTHPDHCKKGVYASGNKLIAIVHGIAPMDSGCFGERGCHVGCFVWGWPNSKSHKYSYLHVLDAKDFEHNVRNEWISKKQIKPIRIEAYRISEMGYLWRKSNKKELKEFLEDRPVWRIPKKEKMEKLKLLKNNFPKPFKIWEGGKWHYDKTTNK